MTQVLMLKTQPVSLDGINVVRWMEGREYTCPDDLLPALIEVGSVEIVSDKAMQAAPENKRKRKRAV